MNTLPHDHLRDQAMPKPKPLPTQERLQELFDYSVITGHLYHRQGRNQGQIAGGVTGTKGYRSVWVDQTLFRAHRLIWCWVTGEDPINQVIDHADRATDNNAWCNLRCATHSDNLANSKLTTRNTSGFKGVSFHRGAQRWMAMAWRGGRPNYLGLFDTPEEAHAAYLAAAERLHGEFARTA